MMESRKEKMNKNFTVVNLPFRVKKVSDKTLESIKKQIELEELVIKIPNDRVKDVKLQKCHPPCLIFKKLKLQNKRTKEIKYKYVKVSNRVELYDYKYFSDFIYTPGINQSNVLKIYENFLKNGPFANNVQNPPESVKKDLEYIKENFCRILPPSFFCKEFAWTNYQFDIEREEEIKLGKRVHSTGRSRSNKTIGVKQVSIKVMDKKIPIPKFIQKMVKANDKIDLLNIKPQDLEIDGTPLIFFLKILFKEKPVWTMNAITKRIKLNKTLCNTSSFSVKKALSKFTYLFKNGPWKFTYVLFNYDPRNDKKSLYYQTFNIGIINRNFMKDDKQEAGIDYKRRTYKNFQVCDLEDPALKEMLKFIYNRILKNYHKIFNPKYGWMSKKEYLHISKRIRNLMKDANLLDREISESLNN